MEGLSLIDVASEDDLLISSSAERHRDLRASGLLENHGHNYFVLEPADAPKEENLVKMSKQWEPIPEMSESPEQKRAKSGKVNLRKSLAWDTAFFTSEGVLDTEELAIVNSTFGKTELCSLPGIQEELQKSTESTSTLDSESYKLENLEGDLFENIRASIQKSLSNRDHCQSGEPDASRLGLRKKVELHPQTKIKPPVALKAIGVSRPQFESTSKGAIGVKEAAKGTGDTKLLLKPPRIVPKPTSLPTVPSNKDSSPPTVPSNKDSSGNVIKNNSRRTSSGNGANRQGTVAFSKTNGDSNRSISSLKANPGSHPGTAATCLSNSSPVSRSSPSAGKSLLQPTRKRSAVRNTKQSLSGSTIKNPVRASKSTLEPSDASRSPTFVNSTFKFSSRASPSSSIDSVASEASSLTSASIKTSNSVESFASSTSSSPSSAIPTDIDAHHHQPTDIRTIPAEQPRIRKEISANLLPSRTIAKASVVTHVSSDPSNEDHIRSSINSNTGAKSFKPSGLRMPSPKIGYFDAEKTLIGSSNKISQIGLRNSSLKDDGGPTNAVAGNKPRSTKIPSIMPAQHACVNFHSLQAQQTPLSPRSMSLALPQSTHQLSKPAQVHKDLSPLTGESSHGMVNKGANESQTTYQFDEEVKHAQLTSGYYQDGHMANEFHSVSIRSQTENLISTSDTNCLPRDSPNECQKILVDIVDKEMSSLSLSETTGLADGD